MSKKELFCCCLFGCVLVLIIIANHDGVHKFDLQSLLDIHWSRPLSHNRTKTGNGRDDESLGANLHHRLGRGVWLWESAKWTGIFLITNRSTRVTWKREGLRRKTLRFSVSCSFVHNTQQSLRVGHKMHHSVARPFLLLLFLALSCVLLCIGFVAASADDTIEEPSISDATLLLPHATKESAVSYTVQAFNGCFKWFVPPSILLRI